MAKKFNFQKAVSSVKSIYNKSHAGFKRANAVAKKIAQGAAALNKQANFVNAIAATHKDRYVRKVNTYVARSKLDKALDDDSNTASVFA